MSKIDLIFDGWIEANGAIVRRKYDNFKINRISSGYTITGETSNAVVTLATLPDEIAELYARAGALYEAKLCYSTLPNTVPSEMAGLHLLVANLNEMFSLMDTWSLTAAELGLVKL